MKKYIDVDMIPFVETLIPNSSFDYVRRCDIDIIPAADVVKVRHGRWEDRGSLSCRCSECRCKSNKETAYCPHCGAKMDFDSVRKYYAIYVDGTFVGHIEAESSEEAVDYARENWVIEAVEAIDEEEQSGRWIPTLIMGEHGKSGYTCSICHSFSSANLDHCPNCGVPMRGNEE